MRRVVLLLGLPVLLALTVSSSVDSSAEAQLEGRHSDSYPAWSPDGRYIAFGRENGGLSVYIIDARTGAERRVVTGSWPSWSPDGMRIAFGDASRGISTVWIDGRGRRRLTPGYPPGPHVAGDAFPQWSPDGRSIVFERTADSGTSTLYVIPASGGKAQRICAGKQTNCEGADWSPDGTKIAFDANHGRIIVARRDGTDVHELATGFGPDWSPDSREITFESGRLIRVIRSDGSHVRTLRTGDWPTFSPDGKRIAYQSGGGLRIIDRNGSHFARLTRPGFNRDESLAWSPDGRMLAFSRTASSGLDGRIWLVKADGTGSRQVSR